MSICPACNGTGPLGAVLGVVCPRCGAGHREHNLEDAFLNRVQEHAEGCIWREAKFWLDANAPQPEDAQP